MEGDPAALLARASAEGFVEGVAAAFPNRKSVKTEGACGGDLGMMEP